MSRTQNHQKQDHRQDMIDDLVRSFNIEPTQAKSVAEQVAPEFTWALEERTLSRGGLADLMDLLGRQMQSTQSPEPEDLAGPTIRDQGDQLLAEMFNSKYKSRALAGRAAKTAGLDPELVKRMMPALAHQYIGELGNNTGATLDRLSDSVRQGGGFSGQQPLEIPDGNIPRRNARQSSPYGDLTDIIRRGGGSASNGAPGGGYLWSIIRNILGSALGFRSKGIMGWIIQMIVYRYGWSILQSILRRVFMGR